MAGTSTSRCLPLSTYLSIASKKEAKVFMGALEKKNFVTTEAGVSTTLLDLTGTGHVRSALGQRLHIEPASHGAPTLKDSRLSSSSSTNSHRRLQRCPASRERTFGCDYNFSFQFSSTLHFSSLCCSFKFPKFSELPRQLTL